MKLTLRTNPPPPRTVMNLTAGAVLLLAGLFLSAASHSAHHGNAPFDMTHPVKVQGTVTDFQWINPHAVIHADVKDDNGKVASFFNTPVLVQDPPSANLAKLISPKR